MKPTEPVNLATQAPSFDRPPGAHRLGIRARLGALVAIAGLIATACTGTTGGGSAGSPSSAGGGTTANGPGGGQAGCTVTFGAAISLTGATSNEGGYVHDGYELYKTEINKAGGIKVGDKKCLVDIKYYDDASTADTSAQLIEKLVTEDKVNLLLGPYGTDPTFAASAVAEKYEIPMVEPAGAAQKIFSRGYKYVFGTLPPAATFFTGVIDAAKAKDPTIKSVAILNSNDGFSTEVANGAEAYAKQQGLEVVYKGQYPNNTQDVSSLLTAVKASNPDLILGAGHAADSILIMKTAKDLKVNAKAFGFSVGPTSPDFRKTLQKDADYVLGTTPWTSVMKFQGDDVFGTPAHFKELMQSTYGADKYPNVPYQAASAAAALIAYQRAIEAAGSIDPKAVRDALAALDVDTFWGHIKFAPEGNSVRPMGVVQLQPDGKTYTIFPQAVANGAFLYPAPAWDGR